MTSTKRTITLALVALAVVVGTSGLAFAAAPTVNTSETANTASDSELTDSDTVTYNASTNSTLQFDADSPNASVKILQDNYTLDEYENGTADEITTLNATSNTTNFTIADDETGYSGVEADAGETVSLTYRLINDTTLDSPDSNNVTINWDNHANKSFVRASSNNTTTAEPGFTARTLASVPLIGPDNTTDPAEVEHDEIGVNGADQDEITVWVEDSNAQSALEETYDESADASAVSWNGAVSVDGELVPVMADSADAPDWLDTDEQTYATVSESGDKIVVYNAGDTLGDDTDTTDVEIRGNEKVSMFDVSSLMQDYGASMLDAWTTAATSGEIVPSNNFAD